MGARWSTFPSLFDLLLALAFDEQFLKIVDEHTRLCLSIKLGRSITSEDAIDTLAEPFATDGVPKRIRCDNGPKFISMAIKEWLDKLGVNVLHIEPGSPCQNGLCESFNSEHRDEYIHPTVFLSENDARIKARASQEDFNNQRPHGSLGCLTPLEHVFLSPTPSLTQSFIASGTENWGMPFSDRLISEGGF